MKKPMLALVALLALAVWSVASDNYSVKVNDCGGRYYIFQGYTDYWLEFELTAHVDLFAVRVFTSASPSRFRRSASFRLDVVELGDIPEGETVKARAHRRRYSDLRLFLCGVDSVSYSLSPPTSIEADSWGAIKRRVAESKPPNR